MRQVQQSLANIVNGSTSSIDAAGVPAARARRTCLRTFHLRFSAHFGEQYLVGVVKDDRVNAVPQTGHVPDVTTVAAAIRAAVRSAFRTAAALTSASRRHTLQDVVAVMLLRR